MTALTLNLDSVIKLTKEQFYQLCAKNPDLKLERNSQGELINTFSGENVLPGFVLNLEKIL